MSAANVDHQPELAPAPGLPDYLASPNAVLKDTEATWRYGRPPDYSKTRKVWAETRKMNHAAGSLPELVENLVKNWEIEASFKTKLSDWRSVDQENYTFSINGGPPQPAEHMLKVGTYNAVIAPNEYYSPENSDFASSHKTFKRMMPTFAWEVTEVYSGPPRVSFQWRHWGVMKNDYVGFNDKGEKITVKAHGGTIDILGITIATVDDKVRLQAVDTYFDPLEMFRQMAPAGIVNRQAINKKVFAVDKAAALDSSVLMDEPALHSHPSRSRSQSRSSRDTKPAAATQTSEVSEVNVPRSLYSSSVTGNVEDRLREGLLGTTRDQSAASGVRDEVDEHLEKPATEVHPHPKTMEELLQPNPGEAVAAPPDSEETVMTHEELSTITATECPFLMNRE